MTTYTTIMLSKPEGDERIPAGTLAYMSTRLRQRIHSMILEEFANSGLSQATLARRLGKEARVVHRWLAAPENMRLSTLSDLVFAINGGEPAANIERPLERPASNQTLPTWLAPKLDNQTAQDEAFYLKSPSTTETSKRNVSEMKNLNPVQ